MNYAPQQKHFAENFSGLGLVIALHLEVIYFVATALVNEITAVRLPQPIDIVNIDQLPKPLAPIVDSVETPKPTLFSEPVILDPQIVTMEPQVGLVPDRVADVGVRQYSQNDTDALQVNTVTVASGAVDVACPNAQRVRASILYPATARREGVQGDVLVRFLVGVTGEIKNISIVSSSNRALNHAAVSAVELFSCAAQGQDISVEVPFSFRLQD